MPEAVVLVRAVSARGQEHDQLGVERAHHTDIVAKIINFHCVDAGRKAGIVIAAPTRDLGAFDRRFRLGVGGVDC